MPAACEGGLRQVWTSRRAHSSRAGAAVRRGARCRQGRRSRSPCDPVPQLRRASSGGRPPCAPPRAPAVPGDTLHGSRGAYDLTLAEHVAEQGPLSPDLVAPLALGLLEAPGALHGSGIVHRDLKPSNVILSPNGPKVIDFGIAQLADGTAMTSTGLRRRVRAGRAAARGAGVRRARRPDHRCRGHLRPGRARRARRRAARGLSARPGRAPPSSGPVRACC